MSALLESGASLIKKARGGDPEGTPLVWMEVSAGNRIAAQHIFSGDSAAPPGQPQAPPPLV